MVPALWDGRSGTAASQGAVLCSAPAWIFRWWWPWKTFSHGIMNVRTVRAGWLQYWLFSLCLVPSSVVSKHNVGIPKFGNTRPMTLTFWMHLERPTRKLKEEICLYFIPRPGGFPLQ